MPGTHYIIQQGDTLSRLAAARGLASWRTIYDHPDNAEFRSRRPNPNLIHPGDELFLPDPEEREDGAAGEQRHSVIVRRERPRLRIRLRDSAGEPIANAEYLLVVGDTELRGRTDGDGLVDQPIPRRAMDGTLALADGTASWTLQLGHLNPLRDADTREPVVSGVQGRLRNLGYAPGPIDDIMGPLTRGAIARFQRNGMSRESAVGELDDETLDALERAYGC